MGLPGSPNTTSLATRTVRSRRCLFCTSSPPVLAASSPVATTSFLRTPAPASEVCIVCTRPALREQSAGRRGAPSASAPTSVRMAIELSGSMLFAKTTPRTKRRSVFSGLVVMTSLMLQGAAASSGGGHVFADRASLLAARDAWCTDSAAAAETYGPIASWDVATVTDMSYLFCASPSWISHGCNTDCASFNSDIGDWDTGRVTTMQVSAWHASPLRLRQTYTCGVDRASQFLDPQLPERSTSPTLRRGSACSKTHRPSTSLSQASTPPP